MNLDFPDLEGHETHTLYIIGNGFDLYHGLQSTYRDFACWLYCKRDKDFVLQMENIFSKLGDPNILWSNLEQKMNDYDVRDLYQRLHQPTKTLWDLEDWKLTAKPVKSTIVKLRPLMKEWAQTLKCHFDKPLLPLSKESLYLTFNYTKTLEDVYHIPDEQICHIHGHVDSDEVIVGHNKKLNALNHYAERDEEEVVERELIEVMNGIDKNISIQIKKNQSFFDRLQDVSRVVVLGHSLNDIDREYFNQVFRLVLDNTHWHFSTHTPCDNVHAHEFVKPYQNIDKDEQKREEIINKMKPENCWFFNF